LNYRSVVFNLSFAFWQAISVKETQLIVALSRPQSGAPTVRVVSPEGELVRAADPKLRREESLAGLEAEEAVQSGEEIMNTQDPAAPTRDIKEESKQVGAESGDVLIERDETSLATELSYSTDRSLNCNQGDVEATAPTFNTENVDLPFGGRECEEGNADGHSKSGGHLLPNDSLESVSSALDHCGVTDDIKSDVDVPSLFVSDIGEIAILRSNSAGTRELDEPIIDVGSEPGDPQNDSKEEGAACEDKALENGGASRGATYHEGRNHLVEHLMLDVDHQVAAIESKLRTAVSNNLDANDTELRMVGDLLEQMQNVRAR
jgi:hypothetical protein